MQISDFFHSYNKNLTMNDSVQTSALNRAENGSVSAHNTGTLQPGTIFEGVVSQNKNGNVVIQLANGESMSAKLGGSVNLTAGQSVFFEVEGYSESNQILIHTIMNNEAGNPTIASALSSAGLPITRQNIQMVQTMMESQLSINKNALQAMARNMLANPQTSIANLALMTKLGIPVNASNVALLENYDTDRSMILNNMNEMMASIPELLTSEEGTSQQALSLTANVLQVLADGLGDNVSSVSDFVTMESLEEAPVLENASVNQVLPATEVAAEAEVQASSGTEAMVEAETLASLETEVVVDAEAGNTPPVGNTGFQQLAGSIISEDGGVIFTQSQASTESLQNPSAFVMDLPEGNRNIPLSVAEFAQMTDGLESLSRTMPQLKSLLTSDGMLRPEVSMKELLQTLANAMQEATPKDAEGIRHFFASQGFGKVLENAMEKQWLLQPEDVFVKDKVKGLYEKLDTQMARLQEVFEKSELPEAKSLAQNAQNVRSNISFLNDVNQVYAYLQIPLKMTNENVHSDLYVFSNKKNIQDTDGTLSAYLSLDMKHLGKTDVYVEMKKGNQVTTNFYLEDTASFDLIEAHINELTRRITDRGYPCTATVENKENPADFVEDFLKQGENVGSVHRYSFDVMA